MSSQLPPVSAGTVSPVATNFMTRSPGSKVEESMEDTEGSALSRTAVHEAVVGILHEFIGILQPQLRDVQLAVDAIPSKVSEMVSQELQGIVSTLQQPSVEEISNLCAAHLEQRSLVNPPAPRFLRPRRWMTPVFSAATTTSVAAAAATCADQQQQQNEHGQAQSFEVSGRTEVPSREHSFIGTDQMTEQHSEPWGASEVGLGSLSTMPTQVANGRLLEGLKRASRNASHNSGSTLEGRTAQSGSSNTRALFLGRGGARTSSGGNSLTPRLSPRISPALGQRFTPSLDEHLYENPHLHPSHPQAVAAEAPLDSLSRDGGYNQGSFSGGGMFSGNEEGIYGGIGSREVVNAAKQQHRSLASGSRVVPGVFESSGRSSSPQGIKSATFGSGNSVGVPPSSAAGCQSSGCQSPRNGTETLDVERLTVHSYGIARVDQIEHFLTDCLLDNGRLTFTSESRRRPSERSFDEEFSLSVRPAVKDRANKYTPATSPLPPMAKPDQLRRGGREQDPGGSHDHCRQEDHEAESTLPGIRVTEGSAELRKVDVAASRLTTSHPSWVSIMPSKHTLDMDMDEIRAEHENALVTKSEPPWPDRTCTAHTDPECGDDLPSMTNGFAAPVSFHFVPAFLLAVFGILPWSKSRVWTWYRNWVILCGTFCFAWSLLMAFMQEDEMYLHLSAAGIMGGGLLGLIFLWVRHIQDILGPNNDRLISYAQRSGFVAKWQMISKKRFNVVVGLWMCTVSAKCLRCWYCDDSPRFLPPFLLTCVFSDGLLAMLVYCELHVCCGLELAIDSFCMRFVCDGDLSRGTTEWNTLQAMLRRAAHTVEGCFLCVNTCVLGVLMLTGREILNLDQSSACLRCHVLWAGWILPTTASVFYIVFRAAAITEKCSRVPALLNSLLCGEGSTVAQDRHYFVQYIIHSAGGFYVTGGRLSATWALKLSYLFGVVVFSLLSQSLLHHRA